MKKVFIIPLIACASCAPKIIHQPVPVPEYEREYVLRPPKGRVTEPAIVEAYPISRYRDPADKNVIHEKHFAYRMQAPTVRLNSEPSERVVLGSAAGLYGGKPKTRPSQLALEDAVVTQRDALRKVGNLEHKVDEISNNQEALAKSQLTLSKDVQQAQQRRIQEQRAKNPGYNPAPQSGEQNAPEEPLIKPSTR